MVNAADLGIAVQRPVSPDIRANTQTNGTLNVFLVAVEEEQPQREAPLVVPRLARKGLPALAAQRVASRSKVTTYRRSH